MGNRGILLGSRSVRQEYFAVLCIPILWVLCFWATFDNDLPHAFGSRLGQFLSRQVDFVYVIGSLVLLVAFAVQQGKMAWMRLAFAGLLNFGIVQGIKYFYWLPRPGEKHIIGLHAGFPSGHAVPAFLLAWLVSRSFPRLAPFWFALATAISWSRVQVHAHFTYQVVLSAVIGCAIGWLAYRIVPLTGQEVPS